MSTMPAAPKSCRDTTRATVIPPPYYPRHRKQMSPFNVRLNDDWARLCERRGLLEAHVARHRLDEGVKS